ncbi:MAG TPA: hypothetical protein VGQ09_14385 [Chitinophagaceae bacterium]|jgi:hypothetical protein|nr:hypothetical protein [Chitinophagaceae bacterium]
MVKVEKELTSLVSSENINLDGKEITKNKKTISELEVSITNGHNIPTTDDEIKAFVPTRHYKFGLEYNINFITLWTAVAWGAELNEFPNITNVWTLVAILA